MAIQRQRRRHIEVVGLRWVESHLTIQHSDLLGSTVIFVRTPMHAKSLSTTTGLSETSRRHSTSPPWPAIISSWFGGDAFAFFSQDFSGPASGPVRGLCVHFPDTASSPGKMHTQPSYWSGSRAVCAFSRYGIVPRECSTIGIPIFGAPCLRDSVAPFHPGLRLFHKEIAVLDRNSARRPFWRGEQ